jgi:hypothetical protein
MERADFSSGSTGTVLPVAPAALEDSERRAGTGSGQPTLLFCIGAAKAGTSWLYRYLRDHPDCYLRSIKELHFFDSVALGNVDARRERLTERLRQLEKDFVSADSQKLVAIGTEIADANAWLDVLNYEGDRTEAYLAYLHGGHRQENLVGDITPAYALLSEEELHTMASLSPDIRVIYIMRDPVERLWSHVRMEATRRHDANKLDDRVARRILRDVLGGNEAEIAARGDYATTIKKLKASVDPKRVLLAFTEEMVTPSGMRTLCNFLGICYVPPQTERRIHEGAELRMGPRQKRAARSFLAPQYDFIEQLFGRLPKAWQPELVKV